MKRMAAPLVGGICTSFIIELFVYPAIYTSWRERALKREPTRDQFIAGSLLDTAHVIGADTTL
jgi:Cu(I)/Ag(I) efflux system membrane protein CusA/SilA